MKQNIEEVANFPHQTVDKTPNKRTGRLNVVMQLPFMKCDNFELIKRYIRSFYTGNILPNRYSHCIVDVYTQYYTNPRRTEIITANICALKKK